MSFPPHFRSTFRFQVARQGRCLARGQGLVQGQGLTEYALILALVAVVAPFLVD